MRAVTAAARALIVALALGLAAAGCATGERSDLLTPPPPRTVAPTGVAGPRATEAAQATEAGQTTPAGPATPVATGSPLDPAALDRELADSDDFRLQREQLVELVGRFVDDERVLAAMRAVPRHSFIPRSQLDDAYADFPLPIGYGQTISQPSLVGMMTELLQVEAGERVLEIGTGSGYQAAILAELTDQVYSVEIVPELAQTARATLHGLGYADVTTDRRDGYLGWSEYAPYDAIVVTAAPDHLPQPLVEQLNEDGGRMVIPIGPVGDVQTLWLVTRQDGEPQMERVLDVRFVPLVREGEGEDGG